MEQKKEIILPAIESGGEGMVNGELWYETHRRFKLKEPKKSIARIPGLSVQTVRKVLRQEKPMPYERARKGDGLLAPYEVFIRQRLSAVGYCAQSIFEELRDRGYKGSYETVKRYVRPWREEAQREATVGFEMPPGRQAQVDWGQAQENPSFRHDSRLQPEVFCLRERG